ncbi:hypothetical protein ES705_41070 [subsurface metagenome]
MHQPHRQYQITRLRKAQPIFSQRPPHLADASPAEKIIKVRPIIRRWPNVIHILLEKLLRSPAENLLRRHVVRPFRIAQLVIPIRFAGLHPRHMHQVEMPLLGKSLHLLYFFFAERLILHHHSRCLNTADHHHLLARLVYPSPFQRRRHRRQHLDRISRRALQPSGQAKRPAGSQSAQSPLDSLHRVQLAFVQGIHPRRPRPLRFQKGHLDHVELLARPLQEMPALSLDQPYVISPIDSPRQLGKLSRQQLNYLPVHLQGHHFDGPFVQGLSHIAASPCSDHQHPRPIRQLINQCRAHPVIAGQFLHLLETIYRADPICIPGQSRLPRLARRSLPEVQAQPGKVSNRPGPHQVHSAQRAVPRRQQFEILEPFVE